MASADVSCTALTVTGTTRGAIREEDLNPETICLSNTSTHLSQHGQGWGTGVGGGGGGGGGGGAACPAPRWWWGGGGGGGGGSGTSETRAS